MAGHSSRKKSKGYDMGGVVNAVSNVAGSVSRNRASAQDDEDKRQAAKNARDTYRDEELKQVKGGASQAELGLTRQRGDIAADRVADSSGPSAPRIYPREQPEGYPPPRAKGGPITRVAGKPIGKDDGLIPAQRGEYVVRKSAAKKLGTAALNQINKGKLPTKGKRK